MQYREKRKKHINRHNTTFLRLKIQGEIRIQMVLKHRTYQFRRENTLNNVIRLLIFGSQACECSRSILSSSKGNPRL